MLNNVKSTTLGDVLTEISQCGHLSQIFGNERLPEEIFKFESRDGSTWCIYILKKSK